MQGLVIAVFLLLSYAAVHHGHPWQMLPLFVIALGAYIMVEADDGPNTDARLAGAMVGFPIFLLGLIIELFFALEWLLFG